MISQHIKRISAITLFILGALSSLPLQAVVREYWVAAEKTSWNYAPSGKNLINPDDGLGVWGQSLIYTKYRYIGYTEPFIFYY